MVDNYYGTQWHALFSYPVMLDSFQNKEYYNLAYLMDFVQVFLVLVLCEIYENIYFILNKIFSCSLSLLIFNFIYKLMTLIFDNIFIVLMYITSFKVDILISFF